MGITPVSPSLSLSLCFPCGLTDHKFTTIGSILIALSVDTRVWLKINNVSIASCSLIFAVSFWVCFVAVVVLHCSGGFSSFFLSPPLLYSLEKKECFPGCSQWYGIRHFFQFHYVNSFDASSCSLVFMAKWLLVGFWTTETRGACLHVV